MHRRHRLALLAPILALALAQPAAAATKLVIKGRGFGHGIGLSQYGAYGYAKHHKSYRFILAHYYQGTAIGSADPSRVVRVLLASPQTARFKGATRAGGRRLSASRTYSVTRNGSNRVTLRDGDGAAVGTFSAPLRVTGPHPLTLLGGAANGVTDGRYRGAFEFRPGRFSGVNAIDAVGLDDYVAGVIPGEMPTSWAMEALKAQAVAARTYAITTDAGGTGFDQYPDTRSQMYKGFGDEDARGNQAAHDTRGEVVTYKDKPVTTFFFSTSGGRTENIENSFIGSDPEPWLVSVRDPYDKISPKHTWGPLTFTMTAARKKLGSLVKGSFRNIKVLKHGVSRRIVQARVYGSRGTTVVTGPQLRARFGLFDTWASFRVVRNGKTVKPPGGGGTTTPPSSGGTGSGGAGAP